MMPTAQMANEIDGVRAEIKQHTAARRPGLLPARLLVGEGAGVMLVGDTEGEDAPKAPLVDQLLGAQHRAHKAVVEYHTADASAALFCLCDARGLVGGDAKRLFAQHVLACVQRPDDHIEVQRVGGANINDVNVVTGDQLVKACHRRSKAVSLAKRHASLI